MNSPHEKGFSKIGALCAIIGSSITLIANLFHPKDFIPYDSATHLKSIASDQSWGVDHFAFLVAGAILFWGLLAISDALAKTSERSLVTLATYSAIIGTVMLACFFVIDGYGMKAASGLWLNAPATETTSALYAALLMSKLGLAFGSAYFFWYLGLMPLLYGTLIIKGGTFPKWIGITAILGSLLGVLASGGFFLFQYNTISLLFFISAQAVVSIWTICAGVVLYRRPSA